MALDSYSGLQGEIADWMERSGDSNLASNTALFVSLFEAWANRNVRAREMQARASLTPDATGSAPLPADFLDVRRVTAPGATKRVLEYVPPDYFDASNPANSGGLPDYYTLEGANLLVSPICTTALTLLYWQSIPALSGSNAANWLLTKHPDVYLAGCLCAAYTWAKNYDEAGLWKNVRDEATARINHQATDTQGPAAIRPYGATP